MPNDDVKTLREAAEALMHTQTIGHTVGASRLALSVCFRTMADMIEREGAPVAMPFATQSLMPEYKFQEPDNTGGAISYSDKGPKELKQPFADALQAAEDRGWNAAIEAAIAKLDLGDALSPQGQALAEVFVKTLRALRREPRT